MMRMKRNMLLLAATALAGLAGAGTITTPHVAGDFNGWTAGANAMTETAAGSDIWTLTISGLTANQRQEFKITDGTWGLSLPSANSWYIADAAGNMTITYDGNTYADGWLTAQDRIGVSYDPQTWTVAGDFIDQIGGVNWNNSDPAGAMTHQGGGIYTLTANNLAPGTYNWKGVMTGTWDSISSDTRSVNTGNAQFTTTATDNSATLYLNAYDGTVKVDVIPEPATMGLIIIAGTATLFMRRLFVL